MAQAPTVSQTTPNSASGGVPTRDDFIRGNRIHVYNGSGSFFLDPYLIVHPHELRAENKNELRAKLELAYGLNNPSFYESTERLPVALNLATLLPRPFGPWREGLTREIEEFNQAAQSGIDPALNDAANERARPFAAIVRDTVREPSRDPVAMQSLKDGLTFYMLLREALTRHGYLNRLNDYVSHQATPDQILSSLQDKIGVSSESLMEAARTGGLQGVNRILGLDPAYLQELSQLVDRASEKEFSYNMIEHWHIGRQLLKDQPHATIDDKVVVGKERRILDTMTQLQAKSKGSTEVPAAVAAHERWVAEGLELVPDIQRQLLWDLHYNICYTDQPTADKIAHYPNIWGLHRTTKDRPVDLRGTYAIYFGTHGDQEASHRTLVHEIHHNLWPSMFAPDAVKAIDDLANADRARIKRVASTLRGDFQNFKTLLNAYHAANATPDQRAAILTQANERYANTLGPLDALFAENKNAHEILDMAEHANDRLHIDGMLYKQSGYNGAQERFREVISRYAELRFVRLRTEPALLNFLAPGLTQIYDRYYIPHLNALHERIVQGQSVPQGRTLAVDAENDNAPTMKKGAPLPEANAPVELPIDDKTRKQPRPDIAASNENEPKRIDRPEDIAKTLKPAEQPETPVKIEEPKIEAPAASHSTPKQAASYADDTRPSSLVDASTLAQHGRALKQLESMGINVS